MDDLSDVSETMMITVAVRASETRRSDARIRDPKAVEIVDSVGRDLSGYDRFLTHEGVVCRTIMFDDAVRGLLLENPCASCISLGCGLDDRFRRVDNGRLEWYNLDLPEVMEVRRRFFPGEERVHDIAMSALDLAWTECVADREVAIVIVEGVTMYLSEEEIRTILGILSGSFGRTYLVAEFMPARFVKGGAERHQVVKKTGAQFRFGVEHCSELEGMCDGVRMLWWKSFNEEVRKHTLRGRLLASIPPFKDMNDMIAVYEMTGRSG